MKKLLPFALLFLFSNILKSQVLPQELEDDLQPYFFIHLHENKIGDWLSYLEKDTSAVIDTIIDGSKKDSFYFYLRCSKKKFQFSN